MATTETTRTSVGAQTSSFAEFFKVWLKIGCINFGGPAGQIAMMHRIVVDEKKWIEETRLVDPLFLVDHHPMHHGDLAGGPAEIDAADLEPDLEELGEAWARACRWVGGALLIHGLYCSRIEGSRRAIKGPAAIPDRACGSSLRSGGAA